MGKKYKHLSRKRDQLHVKKLQLATPVCGILNGTVGKAIWFQATLDYLKSVLPATYFNFEPTHVKNRINKGNELTVGMFAWPCQVRWPKREWFCALIENLTHVKLEPKVLIVALVTVLTPMDWTQVHMHVLDILYQGDTLWHNTKILLVLSFY